MELYPNIPECDWQAYNGPHMLQKRKNFEIITGLYEKQFDFKDEKFADFVRVLFQDAYDLGLCHGLGMEAYEPNARYIKARIENEGKE